MFTSVSYEFHWDTIYTYKQKFIDGFFMTIVISFFALILSLFIGVFFAYGQNSKVILLRFFSRFYIELIRGTPLLVQILIFFYVFANNLGFNNRYIVGTVILALFSGAYVSEIIRAGIRSIHKSQYESAQSLGFTPFQTYRYIIFPQAYKRIIPPLTGQFASIIKDSSLLSIISISEFTMNAQEVNAYTYSTLESYIPLAIGYLMLTYPISFWAKKLEERMKD
ncbi:amino acid ABC transporter permease [Sulfurospirillum diekertiae]|uniref:Putative glutamine transport system permease protein GlnP n=1 Tax=Sulfurospirillum diekertiae TaxID=1854492 RepID=A0A1Y0HNR4_9BACT|nr:amino acid ABC transporter permease [Sulfurospirillum diekertiae]ARU49759.1 Glutamine transport system permease protein GlnP [Sulfurospirillum diekertiae]ASC94554.1 Glutamine transport system permease protein GlnP [Sulfurospirillum diekertiae]